MKNQSIIPALSFILIAGANAAYVTEFSAWSASGDAALVDDVAFLTNAFSNGTDDAVNLNNSGTDPLTTVSLEAFVGLSGGDFLVAGYDISEGTAIKQTFGVLAGDSITFAWQYLTNDINFDLAFIVLNGVVSSLVDGSSTLPGSSYGYSNTVSGTYTSAPFASDTTVTLSIGVADTGDFSTSSALRVTSIIPEPSSLTLVGLGLAGIVGFRRRA